MVANDSDLTYADAANKNHKATFCSPSISEQPLQLHICHNLQYNRVKMLQHCLSCPHFFRSTHFSAPHLVWRIQGWECSTCHLAVPVVLHSNNRQLLAWCDFCNSQSSCENRVVSCCCSSGTSALPFSASSSISSLNRMVLTGPIVRVTDFVSD